MRSPKLAALELKRFGRGKLPRAALVAVVLLPLLYGALYLWSFWDPYGRLDRIPVALVNDDKGARAEGRKISAGDEITKGLRESDVFEWHEVSAAEAREGVEDGAYYLSLTMPRDFSERIASSSGNSPRPAPFRSVRTTPTTTSSARYRGRSSPRCARPRRPTRPARSWTAFSSPSRASMTRRRRRPRAPTSSRAASARPRAQGARRRPRGREGRQRQARRRSVEALQGRERARDRFPQGRGRHPATRRQGQRGGRRHPPVRTGRRQVDR